jgi:hypothetical protein
VYRAEGSVAENRGWRTRSQRRGRIMLESFRLRFRQPKAVEEERIRKARERIARARGPETTLLGSPLSRAAARGRWLSDLPQERLKLSSTICSTRKAEDHVLANGGKAADGRLMRSCYLPAGMSGRSLSQDGSPQPRLRTAARSVAAQAAMVKGARILMSLVVASN